MDIAGYEFQGPFTDATKIPLDGSGVYVVVCLVDDEPHCCLDVGESRQLGEQLRTHDRKPCWQDNVHGEVGYCYKILSGSWDRDLEPNPLGRAPGKGRSEQVGIESELQWKLECACGRNPWQQLEEYWEVYQQYEQRFGPRGSAGMD